MLPLLVVSTLLAVIVLLVGEARRHASTVCVAKLSASTGFVATAVTAGALGEGYGRAILLALSLSWVGDACLLSRRRGWFLAGLAAFLAAHVAFGAAFVVRGCSAAWVLAGVALLTGPALAVRWWLRPYVPSGMRRPVDAYVLVITLMVALSLGAVADGGTPWMATGAIMFWLSDLAVARDRFVAHVLLNRLWGIPLYYGAQLVLACTIAAR